MASTAPTPTVVLDGPGTYKYILIECGDSLLLRGRADCEDHADILQQFRSNEGRGEKRVRALGGGRLRVEGNSVAKVHAYGYSQAFGRVPDLTVVERMLKGAFPEAVVTSSEDGY